MTTPQSASAAPVELWYTRCGSATASALAIRKQWLQQEFAKPGTVLHSLRESDSLAVRNAHYHHQLTGLFREGGNIPPIWAKGQGNDTVVVGITWLDEYQGILTRADSGIKTPADLKGKRLGIPRHAKAVIDFQRGAAQHGFETALKLVGLTVQDAVLVDLDAPTYDTEDGPRRERPAGEYRQVEIEALDSGKVDAIFLRFARGFRLSQDPNYHEVLNINTLADPLLRVNNGTPRPVTVDRRFLQEHREVVVRYLAVLLRTAEWASHHPEEVLSLLAPEDSNASVQEVIGSHGVHVHRSFTPRLTPEYIQGLETQKNFLRDWGYLKHDFDVRDWVDAGPLAEAEQLVAQELANAA
ncbi:MAG TPA: ABC transporter substrate-binding protein [Fluviicoccus sp.]|nr:ABC transporter substrate-binding protein [Fluviicoccus sp.]